MTDTIDSELDALFRQQYPYIATLADYVTDSAMRRRFITKCSKLPQFELVAVQDVIAGRALEAEAGRCDALGGDLAALDRISDVLCEIPNLIEIDNPALLDACIFIAEHLPEGKHTYWECLFRNPNVSTPQIRRLFALGESRDIDSTGWYWSDVARLPGTPEDLLARIMVRVDDIHLWAAIAKHPNSPAAMPDHLLSSKRRKVRELAALATRSSAPHLLRMLADPEESVRMAVAKRKQDLPPLIAAALIRQNTPVSKKQVVSMLGEAPEYAHLRCGSNNAKHYPLFEKARGAVADTGNSVALEQAIAQALRGAHEAVRRAGEGSTILAANESAILAERYARDPEQWMDIVINPHCSSELLSRMFLDGRDVLLNPGVQAGFQRDISYLRTLVPKGAATLKTAAESTLGPVLHYVFVKEFQSSKPDMAVLEALCHNPHTETDTLEVIFETFQLKSVMSHANCPMALRRAALAAPLPVPLAPQAADAGAWRVKDEQWMAARLEQWGGVKQRLELSRTFSKKAMAGFERYFLSGREPAWNRANRDQDDPLPLIFRLWFDPDHSSARWEAIRDLVLAYPDASHIERSLDQSLNLLWQSDNEMYSGVRDTPDGFMGGPEQAIFNFLVGTPGNMPVLHFHGKTFTFKRGLAFSVAYCQSTAGWLKNELVCNSFKLVRYTVEHVFHDVSEAELAKIALDPHSVASVKIFLKRVASYPAPVAGAIDLPRQEYCQRMRELLAQAALPELLQSWWSKCKPRAD